MSKAILVLDETPSICRECPLCNTSNDDDYCCDIIGDVDGEYDGIDQRCPLKPIPKGHGRLGDLDALEKEMIGGIKKSNYEEGYEEFTPINNVDDCVECVRFADTIIEADK